MTIPDTYKGKPVRIAPNGYGYVKDGNKQRLLHHVIAEEALGRKLEKGERVSFIDKDRTNLDPSNIQVAKVSKSKANRIEVLKEKIKMYQTELDELLRDGEQ